MSESLSLPADLAAALDAAMQECERRQFAGNLNYAASYITSLPEAAASYGAAGVEAQLLYVLNNLQTWKGEEARRHKLVLKAFASGKRTL